MHTSDKLEEKRQAVDGVRDMGSSDRRERES